METTSPAKSNAQLLDEKLALLEKARTWSPRVISKFEAFLDSPDEYSLFRANPYRFAENKAVDTQEAIDLFLHANKVGLLKMEWQVLCPSCGDAIESFGALEHVHTHYLCRLCQEACETNLDDFIQVSFTISPNVRSIAYHDPENLEVEDFYYKYHFSPNGRIGEGGPLFKDVLKSIVMGYFYLVPGESRTVEGSRNEGAYFGFDLIHNLGFMLPIVGEPVKDPQQITIRIKDDAHLTSHTEAAPGPVRFTIINETKTKASLMLNCMPAGYKKGVLVFDTFLTGKSLFNNQTFRNLYPNATLGEKGGIGVKDLTLLFTDLKGSTAMYDRIGDLKAFSLVQQHFERLTKSIQSNNGAVVKTIGDAVMASFDKPADAVKAAASMLKEIEEFNIEQGSTEIILKIGIHQGASIAVTLNDRLDYFGQSVNIAARVQGLAGAEEIYLTKNVYLSPGVKELLEEFYVTPETASLKGVQKAMQVYKVTYEAPTKATKKSTKTKPKKGSAKAKKRKVKARRPKRKVSKRRRSLSRR
jgi:class 3 adenylate cyclase